MKLTDEYKKYRADDIMEMRDKGFSLAKIGKKWGVSHETIRMIEVKELRRIRALKNNT